MALKNFIKNSYEELKKVTWPTKPEAIRMVTIVIGFSLLVALLLAASDTFFTFLLRKFVFKI